MRTAARRRILLARRRSRQNLPWWGAALLGLGALGSLGLVAAIGTVFAVYTTYARDYVPIEERLQQQYSGLTEVYDRKGPVEGTLLGALSNPQAHLLNPVKLEDISHYLIDATISTEDNSFWDNPGVNPRGLLRAAYENYFSGDRGSGTGGSSITQQLIKNVYLSDNCYIDPDGKQVCVAPRTVKRKLKEIAFAIELERDYSKEQILEWYLNQISYADRYIGVEAAAQGYFRKAAKDLTLGEAAMLAGIPAAPGRYHPRINCSTDAEGNCGVDALGRWTISGAARDRQAYVLDLMVDHDWISREEAEAAKSEVLYAYPTVSQLKAAAWIDNQIEPRLVRMCEAGWLPKLEGAVDCEESVHNAGWRVTTTVDWALTEKATQMMRDYIARGIEEGCECHNAAIVSIDPKTGQVLVYAPNLDTSNTSDPRVNGVADQLNEINQPGSAFKPAVYLAWFDVLGKHPNNIIWDTSPLSVEGIQVVNPIRGGGGQGLITARSGLGGSQNVPAFRAAAEVGADNVIAMAKKLGITTLDQGFDPTFRSHPDVTYGASIATGGANIKAIDMAYMSSVIANMGVMVGMPTLAPYADPKDFHNTALDQGANYEKALEQAVEFGRGNFRIPGTRELDPVVVLKVETREGEVVWEQGEVERKQVIDPGSVWLLHSIMSDCRARWVIWGCGGSNDDLGLDFFLPESGVKVPSGVKTGTQQGPRSANDTLETWMTGYSRYASNVVWVGNATNDLVNDAAFAAANATVRLWKNWMGVMHAEFQARGVFESPAGFDDLRPPNVAERSVESPTTERGAKGGCDQRITGWVRTDVKYPSQCVEAEIDSRNGLLASDKTAAQFRVTRKFVKLPDFKRDAAIELAKRWGIPILPTEKSAGQSAVAITNPTNGKTISGPTPVLGDVQTGGLKTWILEYGEGANPTEWKKIGEGDKAVSNGVLGTLPADLKPGVYTIRLSATDASLGELSTSVTVNVAAAPEPTRTPTPRGTRTPGPPTTPSPGAGTPTPGGTPTPD